MILVFPSAVSSVVMLNTIRELFNRLRSSENGMNNCFLFKMRLRQQAENYVGDPQPPMNRKKRIIHSQRENGGESTCLALSSGKPEK